MSRQNRPAPASQAPASASSARQNEYFVPRDGIDREVITSDICRYLGNDALVRPGTYESTDGRVTQGYFITAYRNLTSAMIQDLKADSARWEQERRAASRSGAGGAGGSRGEPRGQDYLSWKNRQMDSNSAYGAPPGDRMDVDYAPAPVPLSYGGAPYGGAPAPGYPPAPYQAPPAHGGGPGPYGPGYGYPPNPPTTQYSPGPQTSPDRYPPPMTQPYPPPEPSFVHGSNFNTNSPQGYAAAAPNRMTPMGMTSAPPTRGFSATAGAPYPETDAFGAGAAYGAPAGNPVNPLQFQNLSNPGDPVYGRAPGGAYNTATTNPTPTQAASDDLASPAGTAPPPRQGYSAGPDPQYDEQHPSPALPNAPTPTGNAQLPTPGQPPARRDDLRDRDRDRDARGHRSHRSEADRDDRHAAERARHRQHR